MNEILTSVQLRAEKLCKKYGRRLIVDHVDLEISSGQVVGLLGPNGAGKTTSFYMIVGLARPDSGVISLDGQEITNWAFHKKATSGINYLPQEPSVFRKLSVLDNVQIVLEQQGLKQPARKEEAEKLLDKLGVLSLAKQRADTLSGGERRRVEIARALASAPKFLLLDEPFTGIDPISIEGLQELILQLKDEGLGILISDHNVRETLRVTSYGYLMQSGKIFWEGQPEEITKDEMARKFYLGERFEL
jgi:lipopolysaccharide export system ATP-binding protein